MSQWTSVAPRRLEALDLRHLVVGVEIEVDPRRDVDLRPDPIERDVRSGAVARAEEHEVVGGALARFVVEGRRPEVDLALQVVDADDD